MERVSDGKVSMESLKWEKVSMERVYDMKVCQLRGFVMGIPE